MGRWDITGYSARGRLPLDHALRAGQFRTGSINIFSGYCGHNTTINNYYDSDYYGSYRTKTSTFMKWIMGLSIGGGILSAAGNIIAALRGRGGSEKYSDGAGSVQNNIYVSAEQLAPYNEAYKDLCRITPKSDGGYIITPKKGNPIHVNGSIEDLQHELEKMYPVNRADKRPNADRSSHVKVADNSNLQVKVPEMGKSETRDIDSNPKETEPKNTFKDMIKLYENNNVVNSRPVYKDIGDAFKKDTVLGVFDDSDVPDFDNAKVINVTKDQNGNTVLEMSNGRKYVNIINPYSDGCVYLQDLNSKAGNNTQIYILEKNETTGKFELHQRKFLEDKTIGFGVPATRQMKAE